MSRICLSENCNIFSVLRTHLSIYLITQAKQLSNLLLLNNFYPATSYPDEFEKKATNLFVYDSVRNPAVKRLERKEMAVRDLPAFQLSVFATSNGSKLQAGARGIRVAVSWTRWPTVWQTIRRDSQARYRGRRGSCKFFLHRHASWPNRKVQRWLLMQAEAPVVVGVGTGRITGNRAVKSRYRAQQCARITNGAVRSNVAWHSTRNVNDHFFFFFFFYSLLYLLPFNFYIRWRTRRLDRQTCKFLCPSPDPRLYFVSIDENF